MQAFTYRYLFVLLTRSLRFILHGLVLNPFLSLHLAQIFTQNVSEPGPRGNDSAFIQQLVVAEQQVDIATQQLVAAREEVDSSNQHLVVATQQLDMDAEQLSVAKQQVSILQQQVNVSQQQLAASDQHISLLQQHLSVSNSQLEVAREELNDTKQHLLEMNQQLSQNFKIHTLMSTNRIPGDCTFLMDIRGYISSGQYEVYLDDGQSPRTFPVYCDMETDGGGWTVSIPKMNPKSIIPHSCLRHISNDFRPNLWIARKSLNFTFARESSVFCV